MMDRVHTVHTHSDNSHLSLAAAYFSEWHSPDPNMIACIHQQTNCSALSASCTKPVYRICLKAFAGHTS